MQHAMGATVHEASLAWLLPTCALTSDPAKQLSILIFRWHEVLKAALYTHGDEQDTLLSGGLGAGVL